MALCLRLCQLRPPSEGGMAEAPPGVHVLGEFLFGGDDDLAGIFIFSSAGILSGVEVYGLGQEAPRKLPTPEDLRPFDRTA